MCGRFACGLSPDVVRRLSTYTHSQSKERTTPEFVDLMPSNRSFRTSWNIAPTSTCLCLISAKHLDENEDSATRVLCSMRWSLIPSYHKGSVSDYKFVLNNCRAETIDEKSTFKQPLKKGQRCVVLAEGFFEWKKNVTKTPFFIYKNEPFVNEKRYPDLNVDKLLPEFEENHPGQLPLLAMAGLFEINRHCETDPLYSCTICTVDASETMLNVHIRMPAILNNQEEIDQWLDFGRYNKEKALPLLVSNNDIQMYRVTPNIGSTRINDMNNIRPMIVERTTKSAPVQRNTLDSFVIKKAPSEHFEEPVLVSETKKSNTAKRSQTTIDEFMSKIYKTDAKRFKK